MKVHMRSNYLSDALELRAIPMIVKRTICASWTSLIYVVIIPYCNKSLEGSQFHLIPKVRLVRS
jgi:hypothetical protein